MITCIARVLALVACLCGTQAAYACSYVAPSLKTTFGNSDEVFVAKVLSIRLVKTVLVNIPWPLEPGTMGTYEAAMGTYEAAVRVTKAYKGKSVRSATLVYSRAINLVESCAMDIHVGDELLVLRKRGEQVDVYLGSGRLIPNPTPEYLRALKKLSK
jgi:hypothetical protein